ncbi:hypothetical protein BV25DRAFT_1916838 [Artomyces pyxidatus]|uniref:Uncharacterized protein n=1 Tax=Artomyces pyxidatus TaxID=48021 RepID=A0ACB8SZX8_9AGAM|nr:hypothetical protein BV25DRAFT_1916838 [Artomyces pyxidatus]
MVSNLLALADDVLLKILEYLDFKTLVSFQAIAHAPQTCRKTKVIVTTSVSLQYTIELAACGMLDGSRRGQSLDITERLRQLRLYNAAWRTLRWKKEEEFSRFFGSLPPSLDSNMLITLNVGQSGPPAQYSYYTIPSTLRGVDEQLLDVAMPFPFQLHTLDASQDLLVWLDWPSSRYYLRTISTGDLHPLACNNGIIHTVLDQPQPHYSHVIDIREDLLLETISLLDGIDHIVVDVDGLAEPSSDIFPSFGIQILSFREASSASGRPAGPLSAGPSYFFVFPEVMQQLSAYVSTTATPWRSFDPLARGHFHSDPNDRLLSARVTLPLEEVAQQYRLHIPSNTFLSYLASHPLTEASTSVTVPWSAWGPMGCRATVHPLNIQVTSSEPSVQGMRVLCMHYDGVQQKQTATVLDYHPLRVARALMLERSGSNEVTILRGDTGAGFETTLPCIATDIPLPSGLPHLETRRRGYLCENGVVIMELDGQSMAVKDAWFYTT